MAIEIPGLKEYGSVRDAYDEMKTHLDKVAELRAFIEEHSAGAAFLKAEEGEKFKETMKEADDALEDKLDIGGKYAKSKSILSAIENRIGKLDGIFRSGTANGFYRDEMGKNDFVQAEGSAAVGAAYAVVGHKKKAESILDAIEEDSPKKGELYVGRENSEILTTDNAMAAFLQLCLGNKDKAEAIISELKYEVEMADGLYRTGDRASALPLTPNAIIAATLKCLGKNSEARAMMGSIEDKFMSKDGTYKPVADDIYDGRTDTSSYASMAIAYYTGRFLIKAPQMMEYIEKEVAKKGELFLNGPKLGAVKSLPNALMAIAYALQEDSVRQEQGYWK